MPVTKASNGKWRIGKGPAMYTTRKAAERAYAAYKARKRGKARSEKALRSGKYNIKY